MFCPHCGSSLSDNSKFCSKCGANIAPTLTNTMSASTISEKSSGSNHKKYLFLACIVVLFFCTFLFFRKTGNKLLGTWVCDNVENGYPDSMTLEADGSGIFDGVSGSWYIDGDTFVIALGIYGTYYYEHKLSGNTLLLDGHTYHRPKTTSSSNYLNFDSEENAAFKITSKFDLNKLIIKITGEKYVLSKMWV